MHNTGLLMSVQKCVCHLFDDVSGKVLAEVRKADNLVEEFATWAEFEDDVVILFGFGELDKLDDVGVVNLSHDLDFFEDVCALQNSQQQFAE